MDNDETGAGAFGTFAMSTTTLLIPYPVRLRSPAVRYLCRSWWTCYSSAPHTWRDRCDSLLATGHPLSVIPPTTREALDIVVAPVSGWRGSVPAWFGIPCRIGRARIWLPIEENAGELREFEILVLLPKRELDEAPPFIHLGTQFLLEYHSQVVLDGSSPTTPGRLVIP
jgi:hypothetical protein